MTFKTSVSLPPRSAFDNFRNDSRGRLEAAALRATQFAARDGLRDVRAAMAGAKLGRLGMALGAGSDAEKNGTVRRMPMGFSASGWIYVRSKSERTLGAIESYTEGADITPKRGRYLWIATKEIPNRAGGKRMTPALYRANGFEQKIGPLFQIRGINGYPLLVVKGASVSAAGKSRSAKSRTKSGRLRKGQREKDTIVAFIGIPRTSRAARVDVPATLRKQQQSLGARVIAELRKG